MYRATCPVCGTKVVPHKCAINKLEFEKYQEEQELLKEKLKKAKNK